MKGRRGRNPRVTAYLKGVHAKASKARGERLEREKIRSALAQILSNQIELVAQNEVVHHQTKRRIERQTSEIIEALKEK